MGQNLLLLLSDVIFFPFLRILSARYLLANVEAKLCSEIRAAGARRTERIYHRSKPAGNSAGPPGSGGYDAPTMRERIWSVAVKDSEKW